MVRRREKRRVTGEFYDVGISLAPREERRFRQRRFQIIVAVEPSSSVGHCVHGIFAHEHFGAVPIVTIIALCIVDKPLVGIINVFIHDHVPILAVNDLPRFVGIGRTDIDAARRHDRNVKKLEKIGLPSLIRILAHTQQARRKIIEILIAPIFIPDPDILQAEGSRMPHISADFRPMRFALV